VIIDNSAITIRLTHNELTGPEEMMLPKSQINKLRKAMSMGKGSDIKISKTQIRKAVQHGGSLWSFLFSVGTRLLPKVVLMGTKALSGFATGTLSSLGGLATDKIFGKKDRLMDF